MDLYYFTSGDDSLQHHGIKGQKWGVRRFRKESGGLTAAGKKRYSDAKDEYRSAKKSAKEAYKSASAARKSGKNFDSSQKAYNQAYKKQMTAKQNVKDQRDAYKNTVHDQRAAKKSAKAAAANHKIEQHISENGLSGNAARLASKYEAKGMSRREAEIKAFKVDRNQKRSAKAVVATAAAAGAAYAANKAIRNHQIKKMDEANHAAAEKFFREYQKDLKWKTALAREALANGATEGRFQDMMGNMHEYKRS